MDRPTPRHRYGLVLAASLAVLAAMAALPSDDNGAAGVLVLEAGLLVIAAVTSGVRDRRGLAWVGGAAGLGLAIAVFAGGIPDWLSIGLGGLFLAAAVVTVARGGLDVLRAHGVVPQVIFAGLSVYLLIGLLFASVISAVAGAGHSPYFAQGTDGSVSDRVYFSFITLTTTGYGDFTPGTDLGHSISVIEALFGQIYLVTIVAMLVANLRPDRHAVSAASRARRRRSPERAARNTASTMAFVPPARHLLRAKDLADARYVEPLDVDDLARAAGLSRAHFSREFRRAFGESPHAYLMTRRLERAAALLRTTDRSVADVCFSVGLQSVGSFTTSFRRTYGMSPTAYRVQFPPAAHYARVPACVVRFYARPQRSTFGEDRGAARG